ncbi:type II toxin-antitoxin system VapC family toxin [Halalkalibaculum sp. DA3122]|uniref:type II toxin-antitoxin system VapC family toxin n=1 Tax=unclassified Halalkalibaculum TaxID=2964617 RepID=UPI0037541850
MSGNNLLLDTNIILYFLGGDETLIPLFEDHNLFISFITEIELLGYPSLENTELEQVKGFLKNCTVINMNEGIKNKAISIRRNSSIKLPDAIILASALNIEIPFITADKDFMKMGIGDIIIYER